MRELAMASVCCWFLWAQTAGAQDAATPAAAPVPAPRVIQLEVEGIIDPVVVRYIDRGINYAENRQAALAVLVMDTPGGLDSSMRKITKRLLHAKVPVAIYVYPEGSRAASAGAFIGLAANIIAMAPGTNFGAAHPVDMQGKAAPDKITNDAAAYIRSLADLRGRNPELAEKLVRQSVSLTAAQALAQGMADVVAPDVPALLAAIEKQRVGHGLPAGGLAVGRAQPERVPMRLDEKLLHALTNPNITYVLFLIGIYGLIYELASPGAILPGVVGAISLLLALMGFEGLPISLTGILLMLLGAGLVVLEAFVVSHGILGIGGAVALILGSMMAYPSTLPDFHVAWFVLGVMGIITAGYAVLVIWVAWHLRKKQAVSGTEGLIGAIGRIKESTPDETTVHVQGEDWLVVAGTGPWPVNQAVEVVAVRGLRLQIKPIEPQKE